MIKSIICDFCGKESNIKYGWPDDSDYCRECYVKMQQDYIIEKMEYQYYLLDQIKGELIQLAARFIEVDETT